MRCNGVESAWRPESASTWTTGGMSRLMDKAGTAVETVVRYGRDAMDFLKKKGQEAYSLIENRQVIRKAKSMVEDASRKYAELKTKAADLAKSAYGQVLGGVQVLIGRQPALAGVDSRFLMKHEVPDYGNLKPTARQIEYRKAMEEAREKEAADRLKDDEEAGKVANSIPEQFYKENGGMNVEDFFTAHSEKHMYNPSVKLPGQHNLKKI